MEDYYQHHQACLVMPRSISQHINLSTTHSPTQAEIWDTSWHINEIRFWLAKAMPRWNTHAHMLTPQIAKFMGPTWGPPGSCRPRWAPCWPHELCYQRRTCSKSIKMDHVLYSLFMDMDIIYHSTRSCFVEAQNIFLVVGQTWLTTSITRAEKNITPSGPNSVGRVAPGARLA